jgi:hypothetical protein
VSSPITTLPVLLAGIEQAIESLVVVDPLWGDLTRYVVLGIIDGGPGILPDTAENCGILVTTTETTNSNRLASATEVWVDDQVVVTLFYRVQPDFDKRPSRDQALLHEDQLRRAITGEGWGAPHARRTYLGTTRRLSADRQFWILALKFRFDRYIQIGGT